MAVFIKSRLANIDSLRTNAATASSWLLFYYESNFFIIPQIRDDWYLNNTPISQEQSDNSWLQSTKDTHVAPAAAYGIIAIHDVFDNLQRLQGGMFYQRIHLWATPNGLAMQPMNQMTERADREMSLGIKQTFGNALRELIANPTWQALMTFRLGYPTMEA